MSLAGDWGLVGSFIFDIMLLRYSLLNVSAETDVSWLAWYCRGFRPLQSLKFGSAPVSTRRHVRFKPVQVLLLWPYELFLSIFRDKYIHIYFQSSNPSTSNPITKLAKLICFTTTTKNAINSIWNKRNQTSQGLMWWMSNKSTMKHWFTTNVTSLFTETRKKT